jgi:mRNA-degrading endonuclease RelE of RelBE toxin-antitoxin system
MGMRSIERASTFDKLLKKLSQKHRDLPKTIEEALDRFASARKPIGAKIPNLGGQPVFKVRLPLGNRGKLGGARLIYYCDDDLILALYIYAKSERSDVPLEEINKVLAEEHSEIMEVRAEEHSRPDT